MAQPTELHWHTDRGAESMDHQTTENPAAKIGATCSEATPERAKTRRSPEVERRAKAAFAARWHKSLGPRQHVMGDAKYGYRPSKQEPQPPAFNRPAAEPWTPRNPCVMTMDFALREMEFPSYLAGAKWTVE